MKSSTKNSKKHTENNTIQNNSEIIQNMQKKIKDQAKRLMSMQEYINTLETTLKENNNQSMSSTKNKYNNIPQLNSQLEDDENSELKKNLKYFEEQNEFLKQNLETNIVKNDLRDCLDFLKEKLLIKEKEGKKGNDAYVEILEEIIKIREENKKNMEEKNIMKEKIEEYEKNLGDLRQNMDLINKLNNENNNLYNHNVMIENELNEIKNIYEENQKEINELKEQNLLLIKDNEDFHNLNTNAIYIKEENENLRNILNELQMKLNAVINENNSLKDYKLGYEFFGLDGSLVGVACGLVGLLVGFFIGALVLFALLGLLPAGIHHLRLAGVFAFLTAAAALVDIGADLLGLLLVALDDGGEQLLEGGHLFVDVIGGLLQKLVHLSHYVLAFVDFHLRGDYRPLDEDIGVGADILGIIVGLFFELVSLLAGLLYELVRLALGLGKLFPGGCDQLIALYTGLFLDTARGPVCLGYGADDEFFLLLETGKLALKLLYALFHLLILGIALSQKLLKLFCLLSKHTEPPFLFEKRLLIASLILRYGIPHVFICSGQEHPASRSPCDKAQLHEIRLVNVLDGGRILAGRGGDGIEPDGPAAELCDHSLNHAAVDRIEPQLVDPEHIEPAHCGIAVDEPAPPDLGKIAHAL